MDVPRNWRGLMQPTPALLFLEKKKQKSSDTLPLGKTSGLPVFGKRGGAITLERYRFILHPLFGVFISARPCFRFPNRAGGFSVGRYRRRRGAACSRWAFRVAGRSVWQSLRPSSMATSLCTREALLRITSSCGEEHEGGMNVPTAGVPPLQRHLHSLLQRPTRGRGKPRPYKGCVPCQFCAHGSRHPDL